MNYTPFFVCEYCGTTVTAQISTERTMGGLHHGSLPLCGCPESVEGMEREHRAAMERKKQQRRRSSPSRRRKKKR